MAITSLKPIKARNSVQVYDGRMTERASACGYTNSEARGIFGSRKVQERDGIAFDAEAYERKKKVIVRTKKGKPKRFKSRRPELPHIVTDEEADRIDEFDARRAEAELRRYKSLHAGVKDRMRKRQEAAMRKVMEM